MTAHTQRHVPSVDKALAILELLFHDKRSLSFSEITRQLGIPKSSASMLLTTLEARGYVYRNPQNSRYVLGVKLLDLASVALHGSELCMMAKSQLYALMEKTQLNVHMAIMVCDEIVVVDKVSAVNGVQVPSWCGQHIPGHCSALGKVLLSDCGESQIDFLIRSHGLPRYNYNTIISGPRLKSELLIIRKQGYALDDEEMETGRRCLAVPLRDNKGRVVASINVAGSSEQIDSHNLDSLLRELSRTAADVCGVSA